MDIAFEKSPFSPLWEVKQNFFFLEKVFIQSSEAWFKWNESKICTTSDDKEFFSRGGLQLIYVVWKHTRGPWCVIWKDALPSSLSASCGSWATGWKCSDLPTCLGMCPVYMTPPARVSIVPTGRLEKPLLKQELLFISDQHSELSASLTLMERVSR